MSAIISVLFFVLYWVIDISGTKLANDGAVPPFWGAFISSLILFPIGMYLSWKAVHDSTFKTGGLKMQFRRIKSKISSLLNKTRIVYIGTAEFAVDAMEWKTPRLGTFHLHAYLLRQYRGAAPINWAVINGERITGVTTFMIDHNIDTGGIILRQECRISPTDDAGIVHDNLMELGSDLVLQTVEGIIENSVETRVQRSFVQGSEVLKGDPKLTPELQNKDSHGSATQKNN